MNPRSARHRPEAVDPASPRAGRRRGGSPTDDAGVEAVARALAEDLGPDGDVTTRALVDADERGEGRFVSRARGVLAGADLATETFRQVDPSVETTWERADGDAVDPGDVVATVAGRYRSLLVAERTALNFLCHLSGVATLTREFVSRVPSDVAVLDTRKTTPGLRRFEKAAVVAGGGRNHRMGLSDAVLVKDNHLAGLAIGEAVTRAREAWPALLVEVECDTLDQVREAVAARADRVLLDNMDPATVSEAVAIARGSERPAAVEVSGGITLDNVAAHAAARPDYISIGALTHSAPALDLSLELRRVTR